MQSFWRKLLMRTWRLVPGALILLLILLSAVPKRIAGLSDFIPLFSLIGLFYWSLFTPRQVPYWLAFALGLAQDVAFGAPLGVSSFVNIGFRYVLLTRHRKVVVESFLALWGGFSALALAATGLYWVIFTLIYRQPMPIYNAVVQWFLTVGCYPIAHYFFNRLYGLLMLGSNKGKA